MVNRKLERLLRVHDEIANTENRKAIRRPDHVREGIRDCTLEMLNVLGPAGTKTLVEVGTCLGESTQVLAAVFDRVITVDIDAFIQQGYIPFPEEETCIITDEMIVAFHTMLVNTPNITRLVTTSETASKCVRDSSVDALYVDAGHEYEDIEADLRFWVPKVGPHGIIAGHDFNDDFPGVKRAVLEIAEEGDLTLFKDTSWLVRKEKLKR
jgi:hypothetical protein